ncbi:MAG: MYXO-CTERM sorting domain-containing protein [Polyangiaceae bacterium]|nr:MYXO-CTERM sorting domain-containing protein [Polyangiaceae bacterium]
MNDDNREVDIGTSTGSNFEDTSPLQGEAAYFVYPEDKYGQGSSLYIYLAEAESGGNSGGGSSGGGSSGGGCGVAGGGPAPLASLLGLGLIALRRRKR